MDALSPSPKRYYRPELDVVRFLAFLLVFLHHILPNDPDPRAAAILKEFTPIGYAVVSACRFGLSLFFTLSAFLICELLLREKQATGTIKGKQFYIRRILRIWPLYYLALVLGVAAAFLPGGDPASVWEIGWLAIFMGGWYFSHHATLSSIVYPLWSISVEEQFYLFAPWVLKYLNRKWLYGFCAVLILASNGWLFYLGRILASDDALWYNSFVQFECFAAGILLCLVLGGRVPQLSGGQRVLLLAGSLACWFIASYGLHYRFDPATENPGSWSIIGGYALGSAGSVLVLIAFLGMKPEVLPGWAVYLGRISFGLYVFHILSIVVVHDIFAGTHSYRVPMFLLKICTAFGLNVLIASLSYRYIETPFLKLKKRHAVIESQPV